jgi:hypothetical protein
MTLRSEWLMLFGLGSDLVEVDDILATNKPYMYSCNNCELMIESACWRIQQTYRLNPGRSFHTEARRLFRTMRERDQGSAILRKHCA